MTPIYFKIYLLEYKMLIKGMKYNYSLPSRSKKSMSNFLK